ncbi:MAG: short-chain dehydrogenase [Conexibacter sp.]|nr:short-chain dehydrogenase [Conexibacter sp.]
MTARVTIVTGGAGGMGQAAARRLSEAGDHVVVVDLDAEGARRVAAALPGPAIGVGADVADEAGVEAYTDAGIDAFGRIDAAFLNAGMGGALSSLADQDAADFDRVVAVNLRGVFLGVRAMLREARSRTGGAAVVATTSTAGLSGSDLGAYSAAKHGVVGLVKAAALEGAALGVRVNAIAPGSIGTPMMAAIEARLGGGDDARRALHATTPLGRHQDRYGRAEEVAAVVAFLLGEDASWITGAVVPVDGGVLAMDPYRPSVERHAHA